MIKAIETVYNGYKFRSRLEARWAVFFDKLGITYEYEHEGYDLGVAGWYLPDFWLPDMQVWVEIKPEKPDLRISGVQEYKQCEELARGANKLVLLVGGTPGYFPRNYDPGRFDFDYGVAVFSPDMILCSCEEKSSPNGFVSRLGIGGGWAGVHSRLMEAHYTSSAGLYGFLHRMYGDDPGFPARGDAQALMELDKAYFRKKHGKEHCWGWKYGVADAGYVFNKALSGATKFSLVHGSDGEADPSILRALIQARQARFEKRK